MEFSIKSDFKTFILQVKEGDIKYVKECFKLEYLEMKDKCGMRAIHVASQNGHIEIAKLFLEHLCDIESIDYNGNRPIHLACQNGFIEITKLLLQRKCDIEAIDKRENNVINVTQNTNTEMGDFLGMPKIYIEFNGDEMRPVHYACKFGHVEIVKVLLQHKCDIEARDKKGRRPIHYVCQYRCDKIVELLLQNKCDINATDKVGMRPIHYACQNDNIKIVQLLLQVKCNIAASNDEGMRPLHFACQNNRTKIVQLLLEHQCDIDVSNNEGMRPLHFACQNNNKEIVQLLLEHKCNIDVSNNEGIRPIHYACQNADSKLVILLLQYKCNIDASNKKGMRPIHYACQNDQMEIVKLLLHHKCDIKDCHDYLLQNPNINKSQGILDLLSARKKEQSMGSIALAMSMKCDSNCIHKSCFISSSVNDFLANSYFVGSGAFGEIYRCSKFKRQFAMKIIKTNLNSEVIKEVKNIEKDINKYKNVLRHDNIVEYFGSITEPENIAIFMEFVNGDTLQAEIIKYKTLSASTIAKYSRQILLGISHLHQNQIIHRDIKSTNILLDSGSKVIKLCDFGVSRSLMTISTITTQKATTHCGTPLYTPPEVINEKPYDYSADIWSTGITVIEMLTGNPPFHEMNIFAAIKKIGNLTTFDYTPFGKIPNNLRLFIDQMLQCDPLKRANAAQLLENDFLYLTRF